MAIVNRRDVLRKLLGGLFASAGVGTVVLATASVQAGPTEATGEEKPLPVENPAEPSLEQRADQAVANAHGTIETQGQDEDAFINGAFRNGGGFVNGGFRNAGFVNGGGFRNGGGFVNGGGFRNTGAGGFANGPSFRNW